MSQHQGEKPTQKAIAFFVVIDDALSIIREVCDRIEKAVPSDFEPDADRLMIIRSTVFAGPTVNIAIELLRSGHSLQSWVLLRSAFEVTVRLLWSATTEDGWDRARIYWANQDNKWATDASSDPSSIPIATQVGEHRQAFVEGMQCGPNGLSQAPSLWVMVRELGTNLGNPLTPLADFNDYATYYRGMSGVAHGHPNMLTQLPLEIVAGFAAMVIATITRALLIAGVACTPGAIQPVAGDLGTRVAKVWADIDTLGEQDITGS